MNKETIIEKLENGEYTVEHERYCDCRVESISQESGLILTGNECWRVVCLCVVGQ